MSGRDYDASVEEDLRQLVDIGDGIVGAIQTLCNDPRSDSAELMAAQLEVVRRHVLRLADKLRKAYRE